MTGESLLAPRAFNHCHDSKYAGKKYGPNGVTVGVDASSLTCRCENHVTCSLAQLSDGNFFDVPSCFLPCLPLNQIHHPMFVLW